MPAWSEALRIGVPEIDDQHIAIFDVCERLTTSIAGGSDQSSLDRDLSFLAGYVDAHFAMEERLMERVRYGEYARHRHEHAQYRTALGSLLVAAQTDSAALRKVADSVTTWLLFHIMQEDKALAEHIASSGGATAGLSSAR